MYNFVLLINKIQDPNQKNTMKKIVLLLCLTGIAVFYGYSQMNLTLSDSLGALPNDTTIVKTGAPSTEEIITYIFVKNNSANTMQVKVKKVELSLHPGTLTYFCWGLCFAATVFESPDPLAILAGHENTTDFSGHYNPFDSVGVSIVRYVFFDKDNRNDSVCVNVKYDTRSTGIENIAGYAHSISAFPNPAGNTSSFSYKLAQGTSGSIVIRNLLGSVVKQIPLGNPEGKIAVSVNDLAEGIYFYSLLENGMSVITKKLVVKH
jgi:hypothetical protein